MELDPIISGRTSWSDWLSSPPGRYLIEWEQAQFEAAVADLFGYIALQCGTPELDCLQANRMPSKVQALLNGAQVSELADGQTGSRSAVRQIGRAHV